MHRQPRLVPAALTALLAVAPLAGCSDSGEDGPVAEPPAADDPTTDTPPTGDPDSTAPDTGDVGDAPAPLITVDSQERLVEEAFAIFSGEGWDTTPLALPSVLSGEVGVFEPSDDARVDRPDGVFALAFAADCLSGSGRLEAAIPSGPGEVPWRARLDACTIDPGITGLTFVSGDVDGEWNRGLSARSAELLWTTASGERVSFSGGMRDAAALEGEDVAQFVTEGARQIVLDDVDGGPRRSIEQATSRRRLGNIRTEVEVASMSGGFTFRTALTGGLAVTARTPVELAYRWDVRTPAPDGVPPDSLGEPPLGDVLAGESRTDAQHAAVDRVRRRWAFTTGTLELAAEDGSRLTLDADTGELDTVRITLDEGRGDGAGERLVEWPNGWYRALAPGDRLPSDRAEAAAD